MVFSRAQLRFTAGLVILAAGLAVLVVRPLAGVLVASVRGIASHYRQSSVLDLDTLRREHERLAVLEQSVVGSTGQDADGAYSAVQQALAKAGVDAGRIEAGQDARPRQESYTVQCRTTYGPLGRFMSGCESGPRVCAITSVHATAKSLVQPELDVAVSLTFYRSDPR